MSVDRPSWAPTEVDITRPSVARVYDFYLGGSHNFESDRDVRPDGRSTLTRSCPPILRRQPRVPAPGGALPVAAGIDQFLDLGSGIPTVGNVHEVAQAASPEARVVYVDHDPVAVTHSRELVWRQADGRVVLAADLRDPSRCWTSPAATGRPGPGPAGRGAARRGAALRPDDASGPRELIGALHGRARPGQLPGDRATPLRDGRARGRRRASSVYRQDRLA